MAEQQRPDDHSHEADASTTSAAHPQSPQQSFVPWFTPGSALLVCSLPLGIGSYIGYRRALHSSSPSSSSSSAASTLKGAVFGGKGNSILGQIINPESSVTSPSQNATARAVVSSTPPAVLAARALVLGSLVSLSATSLLVSGIFYASDCNSMGELVSTWRSWGPRMLQGLENSLENAFGVPFGKERRSAKLEYEQATRGMTEEEELEYVRTVCEGEIVWDKSDEGDAANK